MGLPWDAVLHSTRPTALTDLGAAGADAFTIQAIAGHASVITSQRYVHPVPETIQRAVTGSVSIGRLRQSHIVRRWKRSGKQKHPATLSATVGMARIAAGAI
jgi:hypothetical protein